jgi:drug/metabolite transporter (DMT)-like permease
LAGIHSGIKKPSRHVNAILIAIFVTLLWSTSWVLIKIGLRNNMPAITFAGLRYTLAFLCLVPIVLLNPKHCSRLKAFTRRDWGILSLLGIVFITLTQGSMFVALSYLPANMLSLLLNVTSIFVGLAGIVMLKEFPSWFQWAGIALAVLGVGIYFFPMNLPGTQRIGILIGVFCMGMNVVSSLLTREVNRSGRFPPLLVTFVSLGVGSILMLVFGLVFQGVGTLTPGDWIIISWLAVVNSAFAFTLWNRALQVLTAVESSILNSLMLPQIAIFSWFLLGESLTARMIMVGVGALIVQLKRFKEKQTNGQDELPPPVL